MPKPGRAGEGRRGENSVGGNFHDPQITLRVLGHAVGGASVANPGWGVIITRILGSEVTQIYEPAREINLSEGSDQDFYLLTYSHNNMCLFKHRYRITLRKITIHWSYYISGEFANPD